MCSGSGMPMVWKLEMFMRNLCQDNVRLSQSVKFHFINRPIFLFADSN